jgi:hypothetical protein
MWSGIQSTARPTPPAAVAIWAQTWSSGGGALERPRPLFRLVVPSRVAMSDHGQAWAAAFVTSDNEYYVN